MFPPPRPLPGFRRHLGEQPVPGPIPHPSAHNWEPVLPGALLPAAPPATTKTCSSPGHQATSWRGLWEVTRPDSPQTTRHSPRGAAVLGTAGSSKPPTGPRVNGGVHGLECHQPSCLGLTTPRERKLKEWGDDTFKERRKRDLPSGLVTQLLYL